MRIQLGDSSEQVHVVLGVPTIVFNSDAELRASKLTPKYFAFSVVRNSQFDWPVSKLPAVKHRAEWHQFLPTAGHLVYYDVNGVEVVYWERM